MADSNDKGRGGGDRKGTGPGAYAHPHEVLLPCSVDVLFASGSSTFGSWQSAVFRLGARMRVLVGMFSVLVGMFN